MTKRRTVAARRSGRRHPARVLIVVSRFNEGITRKLLSGAEGVLRGAGVPAGSVDVIWVPGAFEIPLAVHRGLATGRYRLAIALGAVIRGETPHFDHISRESARGVSDAAVQFRLPVGFGILTCDTQEQALARAGGTAGNKGAEAAEAALEMARVLDRLDGRAAT
jgi:6,7-dimethyl-8-ribityllumazine synthase